MSGDDKTPEEPEYEKIHLVYESDGDEPNNADLAASGPAKPEGPKRILAKTPREWFAHQRNLAKAKPQKPASKACNEADPNTENILEKLAGADMFGDATGNFLPREPEMQGSATTMAARITMMRAARNIGRSKEFADLRKAIGSFGYRRIVACKDGWLLKGMKSSLENHQVMGVSWMLGQECAETPPYGGILADSMGLGKTVQTLACVLANPPDDKDLETYCGATLVVAPNVLIAKQWYSEFKKHCVENSKPRAIVYKPYNGDPTALAPESYLDYTVVYVNGRGASHT